MKKLLNETTFENLFKATILWRIIYGIIKFISGILLVNVLPNQIFETFNKITRKELLEDPDDFLINIIGNYIEKITESTILFIAIYLIFWGLLDTILSYFIYKKIIWAYPMTIYLIILFVIYQILHLVSNHSLTLVFFIIIDIVIIFVIHREYIKLKSDIK